MYQQELAVCIELVLLSWGARWVVFATHVQYNRRRCARQSATKLHHNEVMIFLNFFFHSWMDCLPDTVWIDCSKPHPSGTPTELKQTPSRDMQISWCDSSLILSSIWSGFCLSFSGVTERHSMEIRQLRSLNWAFFFNVLKKEKENMLTCKWPANKTSENKQKNEQKKKKTELIRPIL